MWHHTYGNTPWSYNCVVMGSGTAHMHTQLASCKNIHSWAITAMFLYYSPCMSVNSWLCPTSMGEYPCQTSMGVYLMQLSFMIHLIVTYILWTIESCIIFYSTESICTTSSVQVPAMPSSEFNSVNWRVFGGYNCTCVVWSFFSDVVAYTCITVHVHVWLYMYMYTPAIFGAYTC